MRRESHGAAGGSGTQPRLTAGESSRGGRLLALVAVGVGFALTIVAPGPAAAITRRWTGAVSFAWADPNNWMPAERPQNDDDLVFDDRGMNRVMSNLIPGLRLHTLTFTDGGYVLGSGESLALTDGITSSVGANTGEISIQVSVETGLVISRAQTWTVRSGKLVLADGAQLNGTLTFNVAAGATATILEPVLLGSVSGEGGVVKNGAGTLELIANSLYLGPTIINAGFVVLDGTLGAGDGTMETGTRVASGGSLVLRARGTAEEALELNGLGQSGTGALQGSDGRGYFLVGPVTLASDVGLHAVAGSTLSFAGPISGPGRLGLGGPGFYNLRSPNNSFRGGVRWGVIGSSDSEVGVEGNNAVPRTTVLDIPAAGKFHLAPNLSNTLAGLAGMGKVTLGTNSTLTLDQTVATTFRGTLEGPGRLVKTGDQVLSFAGAGAGVPVEVQRGLLGVAGGTLGPAMVGARGRLALTRNGTVGTLTVARNGRLGGAPAGSGGSGALLLEPAARFLVVLAGRAIDTFTLVNITGAVALSNAELSVTLAGFTPNVGERFTIIDNDGTDRVTGTFAGLPEGGIVTAGNRRLRVSYVGGTGNDVVLTVVP